MATRPNLQKHGLPVEPLETKNTLDKIECFFEAGLQAACLVCWLGGAIIHG